MTSSTMAENPYTASTTAGSADRFLHVRRTVAIDVATATAALIVLASNALLLWFAYDDRSWGALGIAFAIGPVGNLILSAVGGVSAVILRAVPHRQSLVGYVVASVCLPLAAIPVDGLLIGMMDLHGC